MWPICSQIIFPNLYFLTQHVGVRSLFLHTLANDGGSRQGLILEDGECQDSKSGDTKQFSFVNSFSCSQAISIIAQGLLLALHPAIIFGMLRGSYGTPAIKPQVAVVLSSLICLFWLNSEFQVLLGEIDIQTDLK